MKPALSILLTALLATCGQPTSKKTPPRVQPLAITITAGASLNGDTNNVTTYPNSGPLAITCAVGDLLVAFVGVSGTTVASPTITDSQSLGFDQVTRTLFGSSNGTLYAYIAKGLATSTSETFSISGVTGGSGCVMAVMRIAGMTKVGAAAGGAIVQATTNGPIPVANTPSATFTVAAQTNNVVVAAVLTGVNPPAQSPPTGFTEIGEVGYNSPVIGLEWCYSVSGFTGTTLTWSAASGGSTAGAAIAIELDTSAIKTYQGFALWFQP